MTEFLLGIYPAQRLCGKSRATSSAYNPRSTSWTVSLLLAVLKTAVMGDIGTGLYVSPDVVPVYREMLGQATMITPNHYELE
jgi:hypothetical protein